MHYLVDTTASRSRVIISTKATEICDRLVLCIAYTEPQDKARLLYDGTMAMWLQFVRDSLHLSDAKTGGIIILGAVLHALRGHCSV